MVATKAEFDKRYQEIEAFLTYLEGLEKHPGMSVSLMATMKASVLLMIYNLVESTMTNIVQAVFDHLSNKKIGFESVNDTVKELVLSNVKQCNPKKLVEKMRGKSINMVEASFNREDVFSGNIDGRKIRETLTSFGVSGSGRFDEPVLLEIKEARNDLAHGTKSFADAGKTYTSTDLRTKHTKVGKVLERAISDFGKYLRNGAYA